MTTAILEHVNITVSDPKKTAALLIRLFDWKIRWEGPSLNDGYTVHVGGEDSYLALYSVGKPQASGLSTYVQMGGLNHIALIVEDFEDLETRVLAEGLEPLNYGYYEPGRRFYFYDPDGIEFEVVSYSPSTKNLIDISKNAH